VVSAVQAGPESSESSESTASELSETPESGEAPVQAIRSERRIIGVQFPRGYRMRCPESTLAGGAGL
jgi:hypothetical protein